MPRIPSAASCHRPASSSRWNFPTGEGIRVDTGVEAGDEVTPFYDPMIAKVIAHGKTREQALDVLANALDNTIVAGPRTNAGFLAALVPRAANSAPATSTPASSTRHLDELGATPQGHRQAPPPRSARANC